MAKSWSEVQSVIIAKAMKDEEYRRRLLADPARVAGEEIGEPLPQGAKVKVIEAEPETGYLVLPPLPPAQGELSDASLDTVSGGTSVATSNYLCGGGSTLSAGSCTVSVKGYFYGGVGGYYTVYCIP